MLFARIFVRLPNWVGDIMMARPALHALRAHWPGARLVGMSRAGHRPLVERFGLFDDVLAAPEGAGLVQVAAVWSAACKVREQRPDAAIVMATSFEAALTTWLAGVGVRIGHDTDRRAPLLTGAVRLRVEAHRADALRDLARVLGADAEATVPPLALTAADRAYAARLFHTMSWADETRPILLNPAAAKTPRAWSSDRFRVLAEQLTTGADAQRLIMHARAPFVASTEWGRVHGIALVDDASLPELAALFERCALYIGNDSGPAHLAAAAGIPTVTIFGPSTPGRTGPGVRWSATASAAHDPHQAVSASFACSPCRERFFDECPAPPSVDGRPPCLDAVTVDAVVARVDQVFAGRSVTSVTDC